uniref:Transposase domain-containing protein n=1 Tax=Photinus pyralis TaxID=7054 RepID=A0A1Y1LMP9_PHOPY
MASRRQSKYRFIQSELDRLDNESHDTLTNPDEFQINETEEVKFDCDDVADGYNQVLVAPHFSQNDSNNEPFNDSDSIKSDDIESRNTVIVSQSQALMSFLRDWSLQYNINHLQLTQLVKGLTRIFPNLNVPTDSRTILKTKRTCDIKQFISSYDGLPAGDFVYFGLENTLSKYLLNEKIKGEILKKRKFELIFNIDGIPVAKSSNKQFWPILCRIYLKNFIVRPFPVAIYYGSTKPVSLSLYLKDLVTELNHLIVNGLRHSNMVINVSVLFFTCDAPARAFIKNIKGHNSISGCERCVEKGRYISRRIIYQQHNCPLRTHGSFVNFSDADHHKNDVHSPLINILGFDIINQFCLDYLHLCCLGIMRKLFHYWCRKDSLGNRIVLLPLRKRQIVSKRMIYYATFVPSEFARKSRSIKDLDRFKGTEFRLFLLYIGPIVLKGILSRDLYNHFLLLHCSVRILCNRELFLENRWIERAKQMLLEFVQLSDTLYGKESCIYNVHSLIHLADDVKCTNLSLDDLSCFYFENYLGYLVAQLRRFNRPLEQIVKRLSEKEFCNIIYEKKVSSEVVFSSRTKVLSFKGFNLKAGGRKDCYVLLKNNRIFKITAIENNYIVGFKSSTLLNFYKDPLESKEVGIFKFLKFSNDTLQYDLESIDTKVFVICNNESYIAIKLLHVSQC